jgi:hypothetical protein
MDQTYWRETSEQISRRHDERAKAHDRAARKHDVAAERGGDKAMMHEAAAAWHRACRDDVLRTGAAARARRLGEGPIAGGMTS